MSLVTEKGAERASEAALLEGESMVISENISLSRACDGQFANSEPREGERERERGREREREREQVESPHFSLALAFSRHAAVASPGDSLRVI